VPRSQSIWSHTRLARLCLRTLLLCKPLAGARLAFYLYLVHALNWPNTARHWSGSSIYEPELHVLEAKYMDKGAE
jgi:hypothetical protein